MNGKKSEDAELRTAHWKGIYDLINAQYGRLYDNLARAINNAFLLNGGAAIALLTLIGALRKNDDAVIGFSKGATWALPILAVGLVCCLFANWYLYKNTQGYADDLTSRLPCDEFPFSKYPPNQSEIEKRHNTYLTRAFISFWASVSAFVVALIVLAYHLVLAA